MPLTDAAYRDDTDGPHPLDHFVIVYWVVPYESDGDDGPGAVANAGHGHPASVQVTIASNRGKPLRVDMAGHRRGSLCDNAPESVPESGPFVTNPTATSSHA